MPYVDVVDMFISLRLAGRRKWRALYLEQLLITVTGSHRVRMKGHSFRTNFAWAGRFIMYTEYDRVVAAFMATLMHAVKARNFFKRAEGRIPLFQHR